MDSVCDHAVTVLVAKPVNVPPGCHSRIPKIVLMSSPAISQLEVAYEYIREKLARGDFNPRQRLSRRKLAQEIGVSPALVQHALVQLENEGLVECRPQSGTYPRELSTAEYGNLCDIRELIEPYAAARAAERITLEQLDHLEACCLRFRNLFEEYCDGPRNAAARQALRQQMLQEEQAFHGTILAAAENSLLGNIASTLRLLGRLGPGLLERGDVLTVTRQPKINQEHEGITEALRAHDAELARQRMYEHIRGSRVLMEAACDRD